MTVPELRSYRSKLRDQVRELLLEIDKVDRQIEGEDPRSDGEILTHFVVSSSWDKYSVDEDSTSAITIYYGQDMALFMALGLLDTASIILGEDA